MAVFSRVKQWVSREILTAADLNAEFDNIITNMKPSGVEDASATVSAMQSTTNPGGVGTESLATSLLGELQRLRYVIKRLVGAQWYVDPGRSLAAGGLAVATADIAAGAVTQAKLGPVNIEISDVCVVFESNSASLVDVTDLEVEITTTGRPVCLMLRCADATYGYGYVYTQINGTDTDFFANISFARDATDISRHGISLTAQVISSNKPVLGYAVPPSGFFHIDPVAAGTYTYKVRVYTGSTANTIGFQNIELVAWEM